MSDRRVKYSRLPWGERRYRPLSAAGIILYELLFLLPVIGWIALVICALDPRHVNRRSFARAQLFVILIAALLIVLIQNVDSARDWAQKNAPDAVQLSDRAYRFAASLRERLPVRYYAARALVNGAGFRLVRKMVKLEDCVNEYCDLLNDYMDGKLRLSEIESAASTFEDSYRELETLNDLNYFDLSEAERSYCQEVAERISQKLTFIENHV